jgi:hypothetical protein
VAYFIILLLIYGIEITKKSKKPFTFFFDLDKIQDKKKVFTENQYLCKETKYGSH